MCIYFSDTTATDDPPRPTFDSVLSRDMAGYMPARADFMEVRGNCALSCVCYLLSTFLFDLHDKERDVGENFHE